MTLQKVKTVDKTTCTMACMPAYNWELGVRKEDNETQHTPFWVQKHLMCLGPLIFEISCIFSLFLIRYKTSLISCLSCLCSRLHLFFPKLTQNTL